MSKGNSLRFQQGEVQAPPAEPVKTKWVSMVLTIGQLQSHEIQRLLDSNSDWEPFAATSIYLFLKRKV